MLWSLEGELLKKFLGHQG
jgi:WD40 repeat protein